MSRRSSRSSQLQHLWRPAKELLLPFVRVVLELWPIDAERKHIALRVDPHVAVSRSVRQADVQKRFGSDAVLALVRVDAKNAEVERLLDLKGRRLGHGRRSRDRTADVPDRHAHEQ